MIRFFQKLKQKFSHENRLEKYLLYALGEVILIIFGILIALEIDNWNNHTNEIEALVRSYEQIEQSLEVDLANINEVIDYHTGASRSAKEARSHLKAGKQWSVELSEWITDADNLKIFTPQSSTFDALKQNGIELVENIWLKDQLIRVYEELLEDHKRRESIIEYIRNHYYNVWETQNLDRENDQLHYVIRDYNAVLNDYEYHGNLLTLVSRHRALIKTARELAIEIKSLKAHISQEVIRLKEGTKLPEWKKSIAFEKNGMMMLNGRLKLGLDYGADTSDRKDQWVSLENDLFCMSYPANQKWGVVFITIGRPSNPPRQSEDFSNYKRLSIEMKGEFGGEKVEISIKDKQDPPDGSEDKSEVELTDQWKIYEFDILSEFTTANLHDIYIVTEFVFGTEAQNICVKNISFE